MNLAKRASKTPIARYVTIGAYLLLLAAIIKRTIPRISSSLWVDEIFSVVEFSAKGPLHTLTNYPVPNNHIFFNFLNSLHPFAGSVDPLSARMLSISFLILFIAISFWILLKSQKKVLSFLLLTILCQGTLLELNMQARGYGLLSLCALAHCILLLKIYREPASIPIFSTIGIVTIIGTWTVPTYAFFAAPLQAIILFTIRRKSILIGSILIFILVGLSYYPVFVQLLEAFTSYEGKHGAHFTSLSSFLILGTQYLELSRGASWILLSLPPTIMALTTYRRRNNSHLALFCSLFSAFLIIYTLKTPLPRSVAFLLVPLIFLIGSCAEEWLRDGSELWKNGATLLVLILSVLLSRRIINESKYTPIENWKQTASFLDKSFSSDIELFPLFRKQHLKLYIKNKHAWASTFSEEKFLSGKMVVIENNFKTNKTLNLKEKYNRVQSKFIPQQRGGSQRIYWKKKQRNIND